MELPFYGGSGRQRGRYIGALEHVFGRTKTLLLLEHVNEAPGVLEFAGSELKEDISGRKVFETIALLILGQGRMSC